MNIPDLEKLIKKPRAFRSAWPIKEGPNLKVMILLGSEYLFRYNTSNNFLKVEKNLANLINNRKQK
jgi:hypothetical protein